MENPKITIILNVNSASAHSVNGLSREYELLMEGKGTRWRYGNEEIGAFFSAVLCIILSFEVISGSMATIKM